MKKSQLIVISVLVFILVVIGVLLLTRNQGTSGLRQIKSYDPHGICQSVINPECGNCPGTITDGKCYVKKGTFDQYY